MMLADPLDRPFFWPVGGLIAGLAFLMIGRGKIRED
jgi:hypothetical protein